MSDSNHTWTSVYIDVKDNRHKRHAIEWCVKELGPSWNPTQKRSGSWRWFWCGPKDKNRWHYMFRDKEVAVMFAMRWS